MNGRKNDDNSRPSISAQKLDRLAAGLLSQAVESTGDPLTVFFFYSHTPGRSAVLAAPGTFDELSPDQRRKIARTLGRRIGTMCDPLLSVFFVERRSEGIRITGQAPGNLRVQITQAVERDWLLHPQPKGAPVQRSAAAGTAPYCPELDYVLRGRADAIRHHCAGMHVRRHGPQYWPGPPLRPEYRDWLN